MLERQTGYVYSRDILKYRFNNRHPFNQMRLKLTTELLKMGGFLHDRHIIQPRIATNDEIGLVHHFDYIEAIHHASHGILNPDEAQQYGLDPEETPPFKHMHRHTARIVGGGLNLADLIMSGTLTNGCHLGGGLHHGLPGRANGFCVYNDVAITIQYLSKVYGQRVLYIDTDAHHGDGVQWAFYTDANVLNYSIHETGKFLFPGSGHYTERGQELGYGYTVNIPIEPYTEDASFLKTLKQTLVPIIKDFKPDIIVSVHGADIHCLDPLTHLHCTLDTLYEIPYFIQSLADTYTNGKVIMFGGGGYNIWDVVPRAWSHVFFALNHMPKPQGPLPEKWVNKWQHYCQSDIPTHWEENKETYMTIPRIAEINARNDELAARIIDRFQ